jgi:transposase
MRGEQTGQIQLFSYVPMESQVPMDHPLRAIRDLVDPLLARMSGDFDKIYATRGRPSIPPEQLLKALLLQVLFSIRSELQVIENIRFNLLYRWFVGLNPDDHVWDETVFSKNRERLLSGSIARKFFEEVLDIAKTRNLLSKDHFSVDGTLIEAWASQKSFQSKDDDSDHSGGARNGERDFHGEKRTNDTHASKTDPESKLYRKSQGKEAKLAFMGHVMMENRNGLVVDARVTEANGTAERDAALSMAGDLPGSQRKTLGGDKNYDVRDFNEELRAMNITPHPATKKHTRIDARTKRHSGYAASQVIRKRIEEVFGWAKTVGPIRKVHFRGRRKIEWLFQFTVAVYNLVRIRNLAEI